MYTSLVSYGECIVFGCHDHNFYCLSVGENSLELKYKLLLDSAISSTPCVFVYECVTFVAVATTCGSVYLINYETGKIKGKIALPAQIFSSPCVLNDVLYVGCRDNHLYAIKCKNVIKDDKVT